MPLTIETGLRRGEICGLQWNDIDFDNKTLSCNNALIREENIYTISDLKTETSYRDLPLSNEIIKLLKEHKILQIQNKLKYGQFYIKNKFDNIEYDLVFTKEDGEFLIPSRFL